MDEEHLPVARKASNCEILTPVVQQENAELARSLVDAWNRKDLAAFETLLHDDVEWQDRAQFPDAGVHQGRDEVIRHLREITASLDLRWEIEEVIDCGADVVLVATLRGRGATSGASFEERVFATAHLRDGKVLRRASYSTRAEALEAAECAD